MSSDTPESAGVSHQVPPPPPPPPPAAKPSAAVETMKAASQDALAAIKLFAKNPVGGLAPAYDILGDAKAARVGLTFGIVSVLCFLLGAFFSLPSTDGLFDFLGFGGVMKVILFACIPFGCALGGTIAARKIFGGHGGFGSDCFIPGAALLPAGLCMLLSAIIGNGTIGGILTVFGGTTAVLMMFAGYTRAMKLSDQAATITIPVIIVVAAGIAYRILVSAMMSGFGGGFRMPAGY